MNGASSTQPPQGYNPESSYQGSTEGEQAITDSFAELAKGIEADREQEALDAQRDNLNKPPATQGDNVVHTADQDRHVGETSDTASQVGNNTAPETAHGEKAPGAPNAFDTFHAKDSLPDTQKSGSPEGQGDETSPLSGNAGNTVEGPTKRFDGSGTSADHHLPRAEAGYTSTYDTEAGRISQLQRSPIDGSEVNGAHSIDHERTDTDPADNRADAIEVPTDTVDNVQDNSEQGRNGEIIAERNRLAEEIEKTAEQMLAQIKEFRDKLQRDVEKNNEASMRQINDLKYRYPESSSQLDEIGVQIQQAGQVLPRTEGQLMTHISNSIEEISVEKILSKMTTEDQENGFVKLRSDIKEASKGIFRACETELRALRSHIHELPTTINNIANQMGNDRLRADLYKLANDISIENGKTDRAIRGQFDAIRELDSGIGSNIDELSGLNFDRGEADAVPKQAPEANEPEPKSATESDEPPERRYDNSDNDNRTPEDYL